MAVFSTNQVRQFYVVNKQGTDISKATDLGTIVVKNDKDKNHVYFQYKGAGGITRSDLIDTKNILYAKSAKAADLSRKVKSYIIKLDSTVNGGNLIVGQDYLLKLFFRLYVGMSDEDQYLKYGMVHAYAGMNADKFYKTLANSLALNFSREIIPLVKIEVHSTAKGASHAPFVGGYMEIKPGMVDNGKSDATNPYFVNGSIVDDIDYIRITEAEQPWRLGVMEQVPVYFTVVSDTVTLQGDEVKWADITEGTNGVITNGKTIADMEYFYMGERADLYRKIGWPNNIDTTYLVDPSKSYNTLDIYYSYIGSNESVLKSEKTITLVSADAVEFNKVINALNSATGLTVATV